MGEASSEVSGSRECARHLHEAPIRRGRPGPALGGESAGDAGADHVEAVHARGRRICPTKVSGRWRHGLGEGLSEGRRHGVPHAAGRGDQRGPGVQEWCRVVFAYVHQQEARVPVDVEEQFADAPLVGYVGESVSVKQLDIVTVVRPLPRGGRQVICRICHVSPGDAVGVADEVAEHNDEVGDIGYGVWP